MSFDDILAAAHLPPPGPDLYNARRQLWLTPRRHIATHTPPARHKLDTLLSLPNAAYRQDVWTGGVEKVWRALSSGSRLKYRLPLHLAVTVIHGSWLRDNTWPTGMQPPPDSDEEDKPQNEDDKDIPAAN